MNTNMLRNLSLAALAAATLVATSGCGPGSPLEGVRELGGTESAPTTAIERPAETEGPYEVTRVVDGDTLHVDLDGQDTTIRVIGIDTPETAHPSKPVECFGKEASDNAKALLEGQEVWLESDPVADTVDQYGRHLAYVWIDDDTMFNYEQVAGGYAYEYTFDGQDYKYKSEFKDAQETAEESDEGLWSSDTCDGES